MSQGAHLVARVRVAGQALEEGLRAAGGAEKISGKWLAQCFEGWAIIWE